MLADYMRRYPPKRGSDAEIAWLCLQELPPEERAVVERLVECLRDEIPNAGPHMALEIVWKLGLFWAGRVFLDTARES